MVFREEIDDAETYCVADGIFDEVEMTDSKCLTAKVAILRKFATGKASPPDVN